MGCGRSQQGLLLPHGTGRRTSLQDAVSGASSSLGKVGVSGRYHCRPRHVEEDYVLEDHVLGSGFNGDVVRARSRRTGRPFAVKGFRLRGVGRRQMQRLQTEAKIFLMMDHPHVARLVDVYEGETKLHLVMECMEGGELFQRVVQVKRFREADAAHAVWQMLLAVNYIHSRGVVHRDLKLENFLYPKPGSDDLKLIDFGFSHIWDPNTRMAASCGTLAYVAPEVLASSSTSKCDLWSLGVVAFILLMGYMPFQGEERKQITNIKAGRWTRHPEKWEQITPRAKDFIKSLLVVNPHHRLSAPEALEHPFIASRKSRDSSAPKSPVAETLHALVAFSQASRFRRACLSMMAWSLTDEERARVRDAFIAMDANGQGTITLGELRQALAQVCEVTDEQVRLIFEALDTGATEEINYSEFLAAMVPIRIGMHDDLLGATFQRFDVDRSGYITVENLREVLGESFDGVEVQELIQEADFTKDGQISYDEFIRYLQGNKLEGCISVAASRVVDSELRRARSSDSVNRPTLQASATPAAGLEALPEQPLPLLARLLRSLVAVSACGCLPALAANHSGLWLWQERSSRKK